MFRRLLRILVAWLPAAAVMSVIYYLSSQPDFGGPGWASAFVYRFLGDSPLLVQIEWMLPYLDHYISWGAHFVEFGVLAATIFWGIRWQWPTAQRAYLFAWLATIAYGILDEWHQSFVPNRHPDMRDIATDAAGAAAALGVIWLFEKLLKRIKKRRSTTAMAGDTSAA